MPFDRYAVEQFLYREARLAVQELFYGVAIERHRRAPQGLLISSR